jgi:hypothetical protein
LNDNWRPGRTTFWIWTCWQLSEAQIAFVLPVSIEDGPLLWMVVRNRLLILSTYLLMGAGGLVTLLSKVPALSGSAFRGR